MATTEIIAKSSNSPTSFLSYSQSSRWKYNVFLSFSGDTRKNFTDHLYSSLRQAGINTFIDKEELRKGENLSSELQRAIRGSRISLIVFSRGYASSRWCLDELVQILECKDFRKHTVFPIFYDVDPTEVRMQTSEYGAALASHEPRFGKTKVKKWRDALTKAGELSGWPVQEVANGYHSEVINIIIKKISSILVRQHIFVAQHPVGLESRVKHILRLMDRNIDDNNDVRLIGVYGMGGIGKTTLVKEAYNCAFENFDSSCFLEIRSRMSDSNGIISLQRELLKRLLGMEIEINNFDEGIMVIKERLKVKKSLIVLDDLDCDPNQLYALVDDWKSIGQGSRVIITTRNARILNRLKVDERYLVKKLKDEDSLQLFNLHCFEKSYSPKNYIELSEDIVSYCKGLPLALQVLGAYLFDKEIEDWRTALERLKKIPSNGVLEKLKISFDRLLSESTKDIFLDLACCHPERIEKIYFPKIEIQELIDRSLIIIDERDYLSMHSLIREMGREIVYSESPNNPGERSRLFDANDIREVLLTRKGSTKVEGIALNVSLQNVRVDTKAFKNMPNLRLLQIDNLHVHGNLGISGNIKIKKRPPPAKRSSLVV